jgi:hypothetical protein
LLKIQAAIRLDLFNRSTANLQRVYDKMESSKSTLARLPR